MAIITSGSRTTQTVVQPTRTQPAMTAGTTTQSSSLVVIGVSSTTGQLLVRDTRTGGLTWKPGTQDQIREIQDILNKGGTYNKAYIPPGVRVTEKVRITGTATRQPTPETIVPVIRQDQTDYADQIRRQQTALKKLQPYEAEDGMYDIQQYLLDQKESPGQMLQTLQDAGFSQKVIREATKANLAEGEIARREAALPLQTRIWESITPWDESRGEVPKPVDVGLWVADMVVPLVWTRHLKEGTMTPGEIALNAGLDLLVLIPIAGWIGRSVLKPGVKIAGAAAKTAITTRSLTRTIKAVVPATRELRILAKEARIARAAMRSELKAVTRKKAQALIAPARASKVQKAVIASRNADRKFVEKLSSITEINLKDLKKLERVSGYRGFTKEAKNINRINKEITQAWKDLEAAKLVKVGSKRYARQLAKISRLENKLDKSLVRYGDILQPRVKGGASAGYEAAFSQTRKKIDELEKTVKQLEAKSKKAVQESEKKALHDEWLDYSASLENEKERLAALERAMEAGLPSPEMGSRLFFKREKPPDISQLMDEINLYIARKKGPPAGTGGGRAVTAEKVLKEAQPRLLQEEKVLKEAAKAPERARAPKVKDKVMERVSKAERRRPAPKRAPEAIPSYEYGRMTYAQIARLYGEMTIVDAVAKAILSSKVSTADQQRVKAGIQEVTASAIKAANKAASENATKSQAAERVQEATKTATKQVVKTTPHTTVRNYLPKATPKINAKIRPKLIPKLPIIIPSAQGSEGLVIVPEGTVAWKQGIGWWSIMPPYSRQQDRIFTIEKPRGAMITTDAKSAAGTIQSIGGPSSVDLKLDMGIVDVKISKPPEKPGRPRGERAIRFSPDRNRTYSGITVQRSRSRKVGPYYTKGGRLSRHRV